jgi:SAM-dependent methyltransferase
MRGYGPSTYGDEWAEIYDTRPGAAAVDPDMLDVLAGLARGGRALELGIGTGRVALPLRERGVDVHGIDASEAMVARLRAKPGGEAVPVMMGDFAEVGVDGTFSLVYVVANTFYALLTQEAQVRCFRNVARRLDPGGAFVIAAFVPDVTRFSRGKLVSPVRIERDHVELTVARHDPLTQQVASQHVVLTDGGVRLFPVTLRYVWLSELDLMAELAGLRLRHRWANWQREVFGPDSQHHVSVYAREE